MDPTIIIAIVLLVLVFMVLIVALIKSGVDATLKLWAVLGPLIFGIAAFYFTDKANTDERTRTNNALAGISGRVGESSERAEAVLNAIAPALPLPGADVDQESEIREQDFENRQDLRRTLESTLKDLGEIQRLSEDAMTSAENPRVNN